MRRQYLSIIRQLFGINLFQHDRKFPVISKVKEKFYRLANCDGQIANFHVFGKSNFTAGKSRQSPFLA